MGRTQESQEMSARTVLQRMDEVVDAYCKTNRYQQEELTPGRARTFVRQHRLNTRQRNSVLKLRVATNTPDWDMKMRILHACSQELIADHEFANGKPHWQIVEELGLSIGMDLGDIRATKPTASTEIAWAAWEGLMSNTHWLLGVVANSCAERANVPGYGNGAAREHGNSWVQGQRWRKLFNLSDDQLEFFHVHSAADVDHSNLAWEACAEHAEKLGMEDDVVHACAVNLKVWQLYYHGICDTGALAGA
jgi:pyrroloquinoline quinone (PQQ) biosynthesis protein C